MSRSSTSLASATKGVDDCADAMARQAIPAGVRPESKETQLPVIARAEVLHWKSARSKVTVTSPHLGERREISPGGGSAPGWVATGSRIWDLPVAGTKPGSDFWFLIPTGIPEFG
jgi:hypothetical protein